nr:zinc finger protein 878 isoform X2 [Misgurnus anguillicaudatus]
MSESVSRFQAEVSAVMEVLLKVAVVEITKVFEGRSLDSHGCTVKTGDQIQTDLVSVPDIRAHMQNALTNMSDKTVCSVGVQVEETMLAQNNDESTSSEKDSVCQQESKTLEGLCPSESLCNVDLPCSIFIDNGVDDGKADGITDCPWIGDFKKPETIQENGLQRLVESSSCSSEVSPFNSVVVSIPSEDLNTDTIGQLDLGLMDVNPLSIDETSHIDPPQSSGTIATPAHLTQVTSKSTIEARHASNLKKVRFQLSQTPFDCKLLRPCSVQLVNLLMLSSSVKRTNGASGKFPSAHKDLRTHQNTHTGRRLCCFTECGNGIWRLQGVLTRGHPLVCKICGKKFKRRKILKRHERFHTGEKPYSCRKCKKRFALRKSLRRHERFHTGERPHNCPHCRKAFRLKNNLKAHLRFHTGEKPFACNLCAKSFRISKNLEKHRLTHAAAGK